MSKYGAQQYSLFKIQQGKHYLLLVKISWISTSISTTWF